MGARRVFALVKHLPPGAATWVSVFGAQAVWTQEHELLASLIEVVHHQTVTLVKLLGGKGSHMDELHIPRPGEDPAPATNGHDGVQRLGSAAEVAAFLSAKG